jgi:hypothetical protein
LASRIACAISLVGNGRNETRSRRSRLTLITRPSTERSLEKIP